MKKKSLILAVALALCLQAQNAHALVNWGQNDLWSQLKRAFNSTTKRTSSAEQVGGVTATGYLYTDGDVTFRTNLISNGRYGSNSTVLFSSSTTLQRSGIPYTLVLKAIGNNPTAEATKLPAGTPGQEVTFLIYARAGRKLDNRTRYCSHHAGEVYRMESDHADNDRNVGNFAVR
jgi:hypothetical protein